MFSEDKFKQKQFQHTAARRRLGASKSSIVIHNIVSTHSRPKAAGKENFDALLNLASFNTQPPEGGWKRPQQKNQAKKGFNTQPPEGGWFRRSKLHRLSSSFNTQPPEGGW